MKTSGPQKPAQIIPDRLTTGRVWLLPFALLMAMLGLTILVWRLERIDEQGAIAAACASERAETARDIDASVRTHMQPILRRWREGHLADEKTFSTETNSIVGIEPAIVGIAWIDGSDICRHSVGDGPDEPSVGQDLTKDAHWSDLIALARSNAIYTFSAVKIDAKLGPVVYGALPGTDGRFEKPLSAGAIVFTVRLKPLLDEFEQPDIRGKYAAELSDDGHVFFHTAEQASPGWVKSATAQETEPAHMFNRVWMLRFTPTDEFVAEHLSTAPSWALWTWLAGTVLLIASVYEAIYLQRLHERRMRQHLQSLETLAEMSAAILSQIGARGEVWNRLPQTGSTLLGMSMAAVAMLEDGGRFLRFISDTGLNPSLAGKRFPVEAFPSAVQCLRLRKPLMTSNVLDEPGRLNPEMAERYNARAAVHIPLIIGEQSIGVIMLGNPHPRHFSDGDMRLAELWGGLAAVAAANEQLLEQTQRALAAQRRLTEQRDALFTVNEAIFRPGTTEEILQRMADLAPGALGVDVCQVVLCADMIGELMIAATTVEYGAGLTGYRYKSDGTNSGRVLKERKTIVIPDAPNDDTIHPFLRTQLPCGSLIYEPMLGAGGRPLGLLVLVRKEPGSFADDQLKLTHLFSTRAAAAIENAQLYQQTRRDAETKAMLLRELNHRVKNNLAGIVALLGLHEPELPPDARRWLSRVVDRIRTLARTHELLSGSMDRPSLGELVEQTIRSLSVVTPPGISTRTEIAASLSLRTDRAVSVAMVLHELCYNALVHGLTDHGALLVRASRLPGNLLVLEVIDDGRGMSEDRPVEGRGGVAVATDRRKALAGRSGLGLSLVRDFVSRELRGKFTLESSPGHGTIARVEFALVEDEISKAGA